MSRIGKQLITLPDGVIFKQNGKIINVKGPKGELRITVPQAVNVTFKDNTLAVGVDCPSEKEQKALWGTWASHLKNMVTGVHVGFEKTLELSGVGYKIDLSGSNTLVLEVGHSHPIEYKLPEGIDVKVEKNSIRISGVDKQLVGQVASEIRKVRPAEPYKGKGFKYADEIIRRKAGKAAKGVGVGGTD